MADQKFIRGAAGSKKQERFRCDICGFEKMVDDPAEFKLNHYCKLADLVGKSFLVKPRGDSNFVQSHLENAAAYEITVLDSERIGYVMTGLDKNGEPAGEYDKSLVKLLFDEGDREIWVEDENFLVIKKLEKEL